MKTLGLIGVFICLWQSLAAAEGNDVCFSCHATKDTEAPFVEAQAFGRSIHGNNLCISCHIDAESIPHSNALAPVSCKSCHRIESQIYMTSDHGKAVTKGLSEAAACKDCHGHSHTLLNSRHSDSPVNHKNIPKTCGRCHDDPQRMSKFKLSVSRPFESYKHTIHGSAIERGIANAAVCTDCHGSHDLHGSANSQGRIFWRNVPETCGRCHSNVLAVYRISVHGQATEAGVKEAPVCTSCHGEHTIHSVKDASSAAWIGAVTGTCSRCHASEVVMTKFGLPADRYRTYLDTYHGLAYQRGDLKVANCASCHGFHDILLHTDPRSSIHHSNIAKTCGRCHPGAGDQLAKGSVHGPVRGKHWTLNAAFIFYMAVIPLTICGMLLHNALDFLKKLWNGAINAAHLHSDEIRLNLNERIQHIVLAFTFIMLAYTGFVLKYPSAWWAIPLSFIDEGMRRFLHRWAVVLFCMLAVYHPFYLALTRRGRNVITAYLPRPADLKEAFAAFAAKFQWNKPNPKLSEPYNYIEKAEYWGLVWGTLVMMGTGMILAFPDLTLKYLPAWVSELATMVHFYEAVLACLTILVWHFYWTVFDPEVYPMNWAWITGRVHRQVKG
ncbi:MAG: cytochrome b/b6 domain-containing protein [Elusimicrobia bacterium]|nr:cytochrome b/b6 domain-containing protein [Elusimicrobiota bacterium]